MAEPKAPSSRPYSAQLSKLMAGQAATDQRLEELFRRQDRVEKASGEARDLAREVVTILREQDTGARIQELRAELERQAAALRQDMVAANTILRGQVGDLDTRLKALEADRNKVVGLGAFFGWLARVWPLIVAMAAFFWAGFQTRGG